MPGNTSLFSSSHKIPSLSIRHAYTAAAALRLNLFFLSLKQHWFPFGRLLQCTKFVHLYRRSCELFADLVSPPSSLEMGSRVKGRGSMKMKLFWFWVVIGVVSWDVVDGSELLHFNGTELPYLEYYGVSQVNNPVMVGLTLITSAGAKGAGNCC